VCLSRSWHALKWKELIDVFSASTQNSSCLNVNLPNPPNKCQTSIEQHKMKPPSLVTQTKQTIGHCLDGRRKVRAFRWCHRFGCATTGCCSREVLQNSHFLGIPLYNKIFVRSALYLELTSIFYFSHRLFMQRNL